MSRRQVRIALFALGAGLCLTACKTVGPRYAGPPASSVVNAPEAAAPFVGADNPAFSREIAPGDWWRLYRDPRLDTLIDRAFAANTDLRSAEANLERSQALLRQAKVARQPSVAANLTPGFAQLSAESYLYGGVIAPLGLIDAGVSVAYEVDLFGRIHRAIQAEAADDEAVRAAYDLAKINVAAQVTSAYAQVCGAGEELTAARRSLALQQQSGGLTQRLVRAGRGTALDVTRSIAQISQFQADIPSLESQQRNALFRLAVLTGRPPADFPRDLEGCATAPRLVTPLPVGDGAALLKRRPDIRQAERALAAQTARIGVATADLYPSISFGVTAGTTGAFTDALTRATDRYGVGPNITWQLNPNAARARIAQAKAQLKGGVAHFDGVVLNALRETESALNVYTHDLERNAALTTTRNQAVQAVGQAQSLFKGGKIDFLAFLDAQRSLASTQSALALSDSQLSADQVAIFLALGGGWEAPEVKPRS